ncbi:hypothetical protein HK100_008325 [Physocladia obscura]|uniref:Glycosyltransferase 61 catalytic domain-containing protein n=1 Tax=Physocladia obscura TaxID=109957 RepID=A0AAD5T4V1_9FUNG|nr:hypothetical protein HK100_008325 [Physocladia obscura]
MKIVGAAVFTLLLFILVTAENNQDIMQRIKRLYDTAVADFEHGNFNQAIANFQTLKKVVPDWTDLYFHIAKAEMFNKRIDNAFRILDEAAIQFPTSADFHLEYCDLMASMLYHKNDFVHAQKFKADDEMVSICERAIHLDQKNPMGLRVLATLQTLLGNYAEAIVAFDRWIDEFSHGLPEKQVHETKSNLVEALVRNGNYERAFAIAKSLESEDPENPYHVHKIAYIRTIGWPIDDMAWTYTNRSLHMIVDSLAITNPEICPAGGKWRVALNFTQEAIDYPDRLSILSLNPESAHTVYGRLDDPEFVGKPLEKYPHKFIERDIHLVYMGNAFITGHGGIVHGNCTVYTGGHHVTIDMQSFAENNDARILTITDPVVKVIQHQTRNYYHWILEALPKLLLLKKHVLDLPENKNVKILVPEHGVVAFIDATLGMEEFRGLKERIIEYKLASISRYWFKAGLWQVDWIHDLDDEFGSLNRNIWGAYALKSRGIFPKIATRSDEAGSIVYVSRPNTVRGFPNESELLQYLYQRFGNRLAIHTGREPLLDQIAVFARARLVVGGHGAGLTNFVFTQNGAAMVMVPMDPHIEFCFGHIVAAMGGTHYVVSAIPGAHYYSTYSILSSQQIGLLGDTIQQAYEAVSQNDECLQQTEEKTNIEL